MRKTYKKILGFSLIEVMVGVVLMGIMGTLLMTSLSTSIKVKDAVQDTSLRYQLVRQALSRMVRELSMAYLSRNINVVDPPFITQFKGKKDSVYFSALGHSVHQKDAKESDQQVLGFFLAEDKDGKQALMRRMHANLNKDVEKGGHVQVLCPNVSQLLFSYYDGRAEKWTDSWSADPNNEQAVEETPPKKEGEQQAPKKPSSTTVRLPSLIKITMTVEMGGEEKTWITETEIPIQEPLYLD